MSGSDQPEILSVGEAAQRLPVPDDAARRWLESEGLLSDILGHPVVVWTQVVQRLLEQHVVPAGRPITGCRAAASVLGVGRDQVRRVLAELPPERRPTEVQARGGKKTPWWPTPEAVRAWWMEAHAAAQPTARAKSPRSRSAAQAGTSIEARWAALTAEKAA